LIAVPTTAGTGSEVGRGAMLILDDGRKVGILSPYVVPRSAICDPELTLDLPPLLTAATGMDAITHCCETFMSSALNFPAEGIALDGLWRGWAHIERATKQPHDREARFHMMSASTQGAMSFQKGLGVGHSLAHPLSSLLDTHHGLANAINLPYGMAFNITGSEAKFRKIARTLDLSDETGAGVVKYLHELNERVSIPARLREIGVKEEHLDVLADLAVADFAHPNNPKPVTRTDFKNLYEQAL
jgi:alcohol dehydrogenase class IV